MSCDKMGGVFSLTFFLDPVIENYRAGGAGITPVK